MDTGDDIEFQYLGLRHFFDEAADRQIDWESFFKDQIPLDIRMPFFIRADEDKDAVELF